MIYSALNIIVSKINDYLKLRFSSNSNYLELCNLLDQDGSLAIVDSNKIIATLINIERETAFGINHQILPNNNGKHALTNPPVYINLYILFTSVYTGKNYSEGLKFISSIIEYLQANLVFDHANTPQLGPKIEKLTFEIVNLDIQNLSQLWGAIGGKYMPSILYKIRMLSFDQGQIKSELYSVSQPDFNIEH
ncbi:MAG: DUF4255 domain-containing protein [Paludibacteraceae bacterium]|nr:DUF4255 domain-containing protein [Paludibacteraceae bacterium]